MYLLKKWPVEHAYVTIDAWVDRNPLRMTNSDEQMGLSDAMRGVSPDRSTAAASPVTRAVLLHPGNSYATLYSAKGLDALRRSCPERNIGLGVALARISSMLTLRVSGRSRSRTPLSICAIAAVYLLAQAGP
jgi:hypothetical protein